MESFLTSSVILQNTVTIWYPNLIIFPTGESQPGEFHGETAYGG